MNKILKILKKLIYWLTLVAPVIDAGKTIVNCVGAGIEQGKKDVANARQQANIDFFVDAHRSGNDDINQYLP